MQVRDRSFSVFLSSEQAGSFVAATVVLGMPLCNSIKWSRTMKFLFFWKCVWVGGCCYGGQSGEHYACFRLIGRSVTYG